MRFANIGGRPALVDGNIARVADTGAPDGADLFIHAIANWAEVVPLFESAEGVVFEPALLGPPVPRPGKIVGVPVNYLDHQKEMNVAHTVAGLGFFLKSPTSIVGPNGSIPLPFAGRRTDQEAEVGVVIGRAATDVSATEALDHVFGYTCLVDVTVRGAEERSTRKSFPGFTPIGPWITTADEITDPGNLRVRGWVGDELRQDESTAAMVYGIAELIEFISSVVALEPGDIIATGTPAGVGPISDGDVVKTDIDAVGTLTVPVVSAHREPHPLWLTRETE